MPLTDAACRAAKAGAKPIKLSDGGGLFLLVNPGGRKTWKLAYRFGGKQRNFPIGQFPAVGLAMARRRREVAKEQLALGCDPADPEREQTGPTFREAAERWLQARSARWKASHLDRVQRRLEQNAYPLLGDRPIRSITPQDVLNAVRTVEARGALHIARRTNQAIAGVFRMAIAEGVVTTNPADNLRDALKVIPKVRNRAKLLPSEVPTFLKKLRAYDGEPVTRLAIELTLRTMLRTDEIRFGTWDEIEGDVWRIPSTRMKVWGLEHLIPLPLATRRVLDQLREHSAGSNLICSVNAKPMSENTMLYAIYRLGYHSRLTIHGLRGTASTVMNESGLWHEDWIERQLAHFPRDQIRAAYNAAEYWPQRVRMMQWWNDWLEDADLSDIL